MRAARILGAVLGVLAAVAGIPAADAVTPAVTAPLAYGGDFPDPFVFVNGGRYYAYSTQIWSGDRWTNVPVMSSTNLASWSTIKDALPTLPAWARPGNTWAPGVIRRSGRYLLYYTTTQATTGRQCISVATASTPTGPFRDRSNGPLVCQLSQGGSIDPYPFVDTSGRLYLLWKSDDNAVGQATSLWSRRMTSDGLSWSWGSKAVRLLGEQPTGWHVPMEGPAMVWSGCTSPAGPCVDQTSTTPWLGTGATTAVGPQGPVVFKDLSGALRLGFSGWAGTVGYPAGVRAMWTGLLRFTNGQPTI